MSIKKITIICISLFFTDVCISQRHIREIDNSPKPEDYGKCYAKCTFPDDYETRTIAVFAEYTGDENIEVVDLEYYERTTPAKTKFVKKRDYDCEQLDTNDCMIWCLIEIPELFEVVPVLLDTTQSKNFKIVEEKEKVLIKRGGYREWIQVICEDNITYSMVVDIQEALSEYFIESQILISGQFDKKTKEALAKYQKENYLPKGQLDIETLKKLGISY